MAMTIGLKERRRMKAGNIKEIVLASKQHIQHKYNDERDCIRDTKDELDKLQKQGKILYNSGVREDDANLTKISDKMDELETQLSDVEDSADIFRTTLMMLTELCSKIETIYKQELYKFIIKCVPKNLPDMIKGDKANLTAVQAVITAANEKLTAKFMSALQTDQERAKFKQKFADQKASIKMMYGKSADSNDASEAAKRNAARFGKKADSEVQGVLPVDINNNNTNANINRA